MKRLTPGKIAALCIAFFTLAAGLVVNRVVFERLPHFEDEFAYLYQSKIFARGQWWVGVEHNDDPKYFWQPFVLQHRSDVDGVERRFGKYTPGWPLLLSIGSFIGTPWLVNAVFGMLNVLFVYRLGRQIFSEAVGLVGALLLAISPMALLLNATLMSHVSVMFMGILFTYAYWRIVRNSKGRYIWAAVGGLSLGLMVTTRPLSAVAIAAPVILHAASRLLDTLSSQDKRKLFLPVLKPLLVLSLCVAPTAALWPLGNYIWTGDWATNTYTLLWKYDRPGFGPDIGRNSGGHSMEYAWRNVRNDMKVYLRDLYGFTMSPEIEKYLASNLGWGAGVGLSWILVVAGIIIGRKDEWVWLFFLMLVAIIIVQMTYWIGSVVNGGAAYSLRYWYEATFAVCLVSAYGVVKWANALRPKLSLQGSNAVTVSYLNGIHSGTSFTIPSRATTFAQRLKLAWYTLWPGYMLLFAACLVSLIGYTPARFREPMPPSWSNGLYGYNKVGQQQMESLEVAREKYGSGKEPVLILVLSNPDITKKDNWRDYGSYMAQSSPFMDSEIVVVRIFDKDIAPEMIERFPGRLVLYQIGETLYDSIEAAEAGALQVETSTTG